MRANAPRILRRSMIFQRSVDVVKPQATLEGAHAMNERLQFWRRYDPGPSDPRASKAYRWSALPFGLFCLYGAILAPFIVFMIPDDLGSAAISMPPFETMTAIRVMFLVVAGFLLAMGIGFVTRARWALPLLWVDFAVATFWHGVAGVVASDRLLMFSFVINLPIVYGIDRVTRPAFTTPSGHSFEEEFSVPGRF